MKKFKNLAQENNLAHLFGEMTNSSALSEKKPPLDVFWGQQPIKLIQVVSTSEFHEY